MKYDVAFLSAAIKKLSCVIKYTFVSLNMYFVKFLYH